MSHPLAAMLDARSIAVVGASARPDSFGARMVSEIERSTDRRIALVNPRYDHIGDRACLPSLKHVAEPVDLVLLGVGDDHLVSQLSDAAHIGARSAVVFGSAHGASMRGQLRTIAVDAAMALCGGGCMGFVNVARGLRAVGYLEPDVLARGPIALITHSGSVFSTLLRARRRLGFTLAVSSGQELVTTTADYLDYVLDQTDARVVGLVLETVRDGSRLVRVLRRARGMGIAVVLLPVGHSPLGAAMVQAHSGAVAGESATWEALAEATGTLLVHDLAELSDTLELLALGRRATRHGAGTGIASVHDSGAERTLVTDLAHQLAVPFALLDPATSTHLETLLDDGLQATNPLDVWGRGADTASLFASCLGAMAGDPQVAALAVSVDLVPEFDGDTSYPDAVLQVAAATELPITVLTNLAGAIDDAAAARLRAAGVAVLEGTRSGLIALKHLLSLAEPPAQGVTAPLNATRRDRWSARLERETPVTGVESLALLRDYGLDVVPTGAATDEDGVVGAVVSYPVVLKTDNPSITHKSEVAGIRLGIPDEDALRAAYQQMTQRLGPRVLVSAMVPAGVEVAVGLVRDDALGLLVVVAAGGTLVELLDDRAVALPPLTEARARRMVQRLRLPRLLAGWRNGPGGDIDAVVRAVAAIGQLAVELGDRLDALDVNPLIVSAAGAVAVDALVLARP